MCGHEKASLNTFAGANSLGVLSVRLVLLYWEQSKRFSALRFQPRLLLFC